MKALISNMFNKNVNIVIDNNAKFFAGKNDPPGLRS